MMSSIVSLLLGMINWKFQVADIRSDLQQTRNELLPLWIAIQSLLESAPQAKELSEIHHLEHQYRR